MNDDCADFAEFKANFAKAIVDFASSFDIKIAREQSAIQIFQCFVKALLDEQLVLLIDEYDAPLIAHFHDEDDPEAARFYRAVFNTVKENSKKFRFVFVTGITSYKDAHLLTASNTVTDISMDERYGTICGYTREEIKTVFNEHLSLSAARFYDLPLEQVSEKEIEALLDELSEWYDGYCFDKLCSKRVFNTWSILKFFDALNPLFCCYWYETTGVPSILRKALLKTDLEVLLDRFDDGRLLVNQSAFKNPASLSTMVPEVLLYQCGYLTIAEPFNPDRRDIGGSSVELKVPNQDIKEAFIDLLSSSLLRPKDGTPDIFSRESQLVAEAIKANDLPGLLESFNRLFTFFDYEGRPIKGEATVTTFMQMFVLAMFRNSGVQVNRHEAGGRPDLVFDVGDVTVVIENKYVADDDPQKLDAALNKAVEQIRSHHYGQTLSRTSSLWRIGLVFCGSCRRLERSACAD